MQTINQRNDKGQRVGYWEEYYSNGNLQYKASYKDGKMDGLWEWYWDNGNPFYKGYYKNDQKNGLWEYYYTDGILDETRFYAYIN